ncbi:MAG: M48 family metallopeptidase [Gammaproteobacteria bacterium]|nr:M48 family metallopeptidase [Gammaproteobacteria bacterium]
MTAQLALGPDPAYAVEERASAKARSIRIEIRAGGAVRLVIPRWATRGEAHAFLRERDDWVRRKLAELRARPAAAAPAPLRWDGGDRIPLRGVETALRVAAVSGRRVAVRFDEAITVFAPARDLEQPARLARALRQALIGEARREAEALLREEAARLGVDFAQLALRDPRTLWGSCGADGRIMLSWRLVLAPAPVFRYVAVHELCHLRYRSHGPRFWALVERQMPDYGRHRRWLREHGAALHGILGHSV